MSRERGFVPKSFVEAGTINSDGSVVVYKSRLTLYKKEG